MLAATLALLLGMQGVSTSPAEGEEIVVTGTRPSPQAARRHVAEITRPINGHIATLRRPACPEVIGLAPRHSALIVARIREVARRAAITVAEGGCTPNVHLVVVDDGRSFIGALRRKLPSAFEGMELYEIRRLRDLPPPARAWSASVLQDEEGRYNGATIDVDGVAIPAMFVKSASIINQPHRQAALHSFVVIDEAALIGKDLVQIADYVVVRALGSAEPPTKGSAVETILTLFDGGGEKPLSLTPADFAYISTLNNTPPDIGIHALRARLARAIAEPKAPESDRP
jgi:hypothetical protein